MEWLDPIYNCGHWIPYQIAQAGGVDMLSNPSGYSIVMPWKKIVKYNPEVLIIAPCGLKVERVEKEIGILQAYPEWNELLAVKNNSVYITDANLFTQPSTTLVDGIELLAALFHPTLFTLSERFRNTYKKVIAVKEHNAVYQ
jgi:iron complex transport system substrate-binding protein